MQSSPVRGGRQGSDLRTRLREARPIINATDGSRGCTIINRVLTSGSTRSRSIRSSLCIEGVGARTGQKIGVRGDTAGPLGAVRSDHIVGSSG